MSDYCIDTDIYTFHVTRTPETIEIHGEGLCIISVNRPDSPPVKRGFHQLDIATIYINDVVGDNCDETIYMIRTALSESLRLYPYINTYIFTGTSHFTCINHSLSLFLIKYKKTWYEYHFHAYLVDSEQRKRYADGLQILDDPTMKVPFDDFTTIVYPYEMSTEFQSIYETSPTYSDIFTRSILHYHGRSSWIDVFIQYIFQFNPNTALWAIKKECIAHYECPS